MADRLEDLLRACTVRVLGGPMTGAGFFIAPGTVITCAHVAGDGAGLRVRWERDGQPPREAPVSGTPMVLAGGGRPIPALDADYPDLAVLNVTGFDGHPCVSIDPQWPDPQDQFQVFGYPREGGAEQLTPARLTYRGTHGTAPTAFLDLASDTIKPGMSGAAVLNLRSGGVCGAVVASKHPSRPDGALVIPWPAVEVPLGEVLAANRAYQLRDLLWATAAGQRQTPAAEPAGSAAPGQSLTRRPVRVFISHAHEDHTHEDRVRHLWMFLRAQGIDARLDLTAAEQRQDWAQWMMQEVRDADYVLVIASPGYKRRAEGEAAPGEGRDVQWEARLIREVFYADQDAGLRRFLPVVLPDGTANDIPLWLAPTSASHYVVTDYSVTGMEKLYRLLTDQPWETVPDLGTVTKLPPRGTGHTVTPSPGTEAATMATEAEPVTPSQPALRTEVVIEAAVSDAGMLESVVWLAGTQLCRQQVPLPFEVTQVWGALQLPALAAGDRLAEAGRRLAGALLDDQSQALLAGLLNRLPPDGTVQVVLSASGPALSLPIELLRLTTGSGGETVPLGLIPAVSISRRPATQGFGEGPGTAPPPVSTAGPLKVLVAVAAPDETKTDNAALDTEAEMAAVLEAVSDVAASPHAQVRILEVASLPAIRAALTHDAYDLVRDSASGA